MLTHFQKDTYPGLLFLVKAGGVGLERWILAQSYLALYSLLLSSVPAQQMMMG